MQFLNTKYSIGDRVVYYSERSGLVEKIISRVRVTFCNRDGEDQEYIEYKFETPFLLEIFDSWFNEDTIYASKDEFISKIQASI